MRQIPADQPHRPYDQHGLEQSAVPTCAEINASIDVLTGAAYGGCLLKQHGHKTTSVAPPRSSITASSDDTDQFVTDVHSICAQVPVQRSGVIRTNASTSDYAQKISTDDVGMQIPAHQALHHLTRHTSLVTNVDYNNVQR